MQKFCVKILVKCQGWTFCIFASQSSFLIIKSLEKLATKDFFTPHLPEYLLELQYNKIEQNKLM